LGDDESCVHVAYAGRCSNGYDDGEWQQDVRDCERGGLKHVFSCVSCGDSWIYVFNELFDGRESVI